MVAILSVRQKEIIVEMGRFKIGNLVTKEESARVVVLVQIILNV